jgi:hypothetical protein
VLPEAGFAAAYLGFSPHSAPHSRVVRIFGRGGKRRPWLPSLLTIEHENSRKRWVRYPKEVRVGVRLGTDRDGLRKQNTVWQHLEHRFALSEKVRKTVGFGEPLLRQEATRGVEWLTGPAIRSPRKEVPDRARDTVRSAAAGSSRVLVKRADERDMDEPLFGERAAMRSQTLWALSKHHLMWLTPASDVSTVDSGPSP